MVQKNKPKNAPPKNDVSPNPLDMPEAPRSADEAAPNGKDHSEASPGAGFPIVGIGASAGGLSAFEAFFSGLPADTDPGIAFVLVQHLAPDHKSILTDLIRRYTRLKVLEVEDGMVVHPNCAYIIPPGRDMACLGGTLSLLQPTAPRGPLRYSAGPFGPLGTRARRSTPVVMPGPGIAIRSNGWRFVVCGHGERIRVVQTPSEGTCRGTIPRTGP